MGLAETVLRLLVLRPLISIRVMMIAPAPTCRG